MKSDDPMFRDSKPILTRQVPSIGLSKRHRTTGKQATMFFVSRVEELQMKGLDCDPIQVLMEIASGKVLEANGTVTEMMPKPDPAVRQKAAAELCSYIFPKRKAVEVSGDNENPLQFVVMRDEDALPGATNAITLDGYQKNQLIEAILEDDEESDAISADLEADIS